MSGLNRVEIIVLVLVIGVLLLLAVPWLLHTREDARLVQCRANLRNIGIALGEYATANGRVFPYGTIVNSDLPPEKRLAWTLPAASFVDQLDQREPNVLIAFDLNKPWDAPANRSPEGGDDKESDRVRRFAIFHCPADANISPGRELATSSYVGMAGIGEEAPALKRLSANAGIWGYERQTEYDQMTDGLEQTICVLDTSNDNGPWIAGGPPTVRPVLPDGERFLGESGQFGGHHPEGSAILFADGSVRIFAYRTDPAAFLPLCTPAEQ